jgi:23S rRNA pseudouridine2605 synthase
MPRKPPRRPGRGNDKRGSGRPGSGRPGSGRGGPGRGGSRSGARPRVPTQPIEGADTPVRLQAFLARAGVASRRASETLIEEGRVRVNGQVVTELGTKVTPDRDTVAVDGDEVELRRPLWVALHKPRGYVTTRDDPSGRRTVYDLLPTDLHHLFHVGRLDRQSEGLLLLTNEGEVAHRLLHPSFGMDKEYVATIEGAPTYEDLDLLVQGVEVEGETLRADSVEVLPGAERGETRLRMILREGRYREVRRMLEAVGHTVSKLVRRRFGPIRLGQLRRGEWRELTPQELAALRGTDRRQSTS